MWYLLAIAAGIAADQWLKFWVVEHLAPGESAPLLPGLVELYYLRNTGGGFSVLTGKTGLLSVITALVMLVLAVLLLRRHFDHPLAMWSISLVLSGGIGNLMDRLRLGYVVDMFNFQFMSYPVFNIADILVVVGVIGFSVYYVLLEGKTS